MKYLRLSKSRPWAALSVHATWIAFVLFALMAGSNSVAIHFSNLELPPFWGAASRFAAAAIVSWIVVLVRRIPLPRGRALAGVVLYGIVGIGVSFAFIYWSLVRVQAGMASIFLALVPLLTVLLAAVHGLEALRGRRLAAALVAVGGIAIIAGGGPQADLATPVLLALIAFPVAMAEGAVILKLFPPGSPWADNAVSLSVGALLLAGLSLLTGEPWSLPSAPTTWAAFGYLVIIGTTLVFYLWLYLLARWPATKTAYGFVLMPMVSITLSVLLTGEVITLSFVLGAALALVGVWLGAIGGLPRGAAPQPAAAPTVAPGPDLADCLPDC